MAWALVVVGCAGFVALGLWIAGAIGRIDEPNAPIGWSGVVVFGAFGLIGIRRLGVTGDAVRVDAVGIWRWRADGGLTIPWDAVRRVGVRQLRRQHFLCLWLDRPDLHRARGPGGRVAGANGAMGFGDIAPGVQGTDRRFADLEAAAERFAPARLLD